MRNASNERDGRTGWLKYLSTNHALITAVIVDKTATTDKQVDVALLIFDHILFFSLFFAIIY